MLKADSKTMDLSIFVPCYNEEKLVTLTFEDILKAIEPFKISYEVLVYDDGSKDGTANIVRQYISDHHLENHFSLIVCEKNYGVGVNYFRAAERALGNYFIGISGDNGEPCEAMQRIFGLIGAADVIVPHPDTRLFDLKFNGDNRPFKRRLMSVVYTKIVRFISGHNLHYFNSSILYKREHVLKHRVSTFGLGYNAELLCNVLNEPHITFLEVKVSNKDRVYGFTSAFRPRNVFAVLGTLARILKRCRFSRPRQ